MPAQTTEQQWAAGVEIDLATWFVDDGWRLLPDELRRQLEARGATPDDINVLVDEGARRRAAEADRDPPPAATPETPAAPASLNYVPAEYALGALLFAGSYSAATSAAVLEQVRTAGLEARMFPRERDRLVFSAIAAVTDRGAPCEYMLVEEELRRAGQLERAGGPSYVRELANLGPSAVNAPHYANLVVAEARRAETETAGLRLVEQSRNGGVTANTRAALLELLERPDPGGPAPEAIDAGTFVFDEPTDPAAIRLWGDGLAIGWASGEGLMLVGPDGVGKTTLGQQLALARCGLRPDLLGMPVTRDPRRVLYIAADRPRQAARSMRRMVSEQERDELAERMVIWKGPPPAMLNDDRTGLARLAKQYGAGTVIVDSLKDVAVDLAGDEAGGRVSAAFQHLIATGVELLVLHHPRKPGQDQKGKARELSDVYGSRLIFGAFGSVLMLWGEPGDSYVQLRHLKQPHEPVGPWQLHHDHPVGHTTIEKGTDLIDVVERAGGEGLTAKDAAAILFEKDTPTKNEIDRIRKRLGQLADAGRIAKTSGGRTGGLGGGALEQARYTAAGPGAALHAVPDPEDLF